ncbi:MAG TPA: sulfatase-like hydrolase/transferase [Candidatus Limnocylindria bacterium]|nr:sulfatase-like hydrolase/transferase [Candidatus Limnocylindria bacterium]
MLTRRPREGRVDWRTLPVHPLGMAAFPVLFLFAENVVQQVTLRPLWEPLALALMMAAVTLLACVAILRDWLRGALLASLLLALFFSFGHARNLLGAVVPAVQVLAAAYLCVGLVGAWLIRRGGGWVRPATTALNLALVVLVAINGARIVAFAGGSAQAAGPMATPAFAADQSAPRRDIYYIVLDRYANAETLREFFGFDNTPFLSALQARGFVIAEDAWANYFKTAFSVAAAMSMDYLDPERFDLTEPPTFGPLHDYLRDHLPVPVTLKALGYEYVHLGSDWEPTATNVDADLSLRYEDYSEFSAALWATTAQSLLSPPVDEDEDPESVNRPELARATTLFTFEQLEQVSERRGPTFVFAHLLVPHPPYVFDSDGSMPTEEESLTRSTVEKYTHQLKWTNQRVLEVMDELLDAPPGQEPIILLQADEGPYPGRFRGDPADFNWLEASDEDIQHKFGILSALHLPGVDHREAGVTDRTSQVNLFRIVFNAYFEANLPLLPDITYLSPDYAHMYDFVAYPR